MKLNIKNSILITVATLSVVFSSCYDEKMKWENSKDDVNINELPISSNEKLALYKDLGTYNKENILLGAGIDLNTYMTNDTYKKLADDNFKSITVGYDMKHGAMVQGDGSLNFTNVDNLLAALPASTAVYGHTLVWHSNQNAGYLNGLIAPQRLPGPAGSNQLDLTGLKDGSFTGWTKANNAAGISIVADGGLTSGDPVLRLQTTTAGNEWDTQLIGPNIQATVGHNYEITFWIKSDVAGAGRMSFDGMSNNYPWVNGDAYFYTTTDWKQVVYDVVSSADPIHIAFDLGKFPAVYYVDINTITVVDLDAPSGEYNYVTNGDFETGDLTGWTAQNPGDGISVETEAAKTGKYGLKAVSSAASHNEWDLQFITDAMTLDPSKTYTFSFNIKSDVAGEGRISFPGQLNAGGSANEYPWLDWTGSGAAAHFKTPAGVWTTVSVDIQPQTTSLKLSFDIGTNPSVTYFIDDVKVVAQDGGAPPTGPVVIEKTDAEKAKIIGDALQSWISQMVTHYKGRVHAWDVVNEPMDESGALKSGIGLTQASDEFYWQDYLGKDYAVTAFNLARQYGNSDDKLFINDYNLETNSAKLTGLINYVSYIESKGAKVDGIGTQMHLTLGYTTKDGIDQMFQQLAATGKLIRVSELDIKIGTNAPSADQLNQQADLFQYVITSYLKNIPASQQYGITIWGIGDKDSWITGDAPLLWDKNYARKTAYKGYCDGLYGGDVSADWDYGDMINGGSGN